VNPVNAAQPANLVQLVQLVNLANVVNLDPEDSLVKTENLDQKVLLVTEVPWV
jgi:hypothetical protein